MKIARLSSTQYRFWRSNQQFLVDENGVDIIRPATLAEAQAARPVIVAVPVLGKDGQPQKNNDGSELREEKLFELKTSRDLLKQDMLAQYGECIITAHGNRRLAVVRDPDIIRAGPEQKNSPPPINCNCRDWGDPHPGRHHPACQWNSVAAPHERATKEDQLKTMPTGFVASPIPGHMVPGQSSPELAPEECSCRKWKIGPEGWKAGVNHHPDCQYSSTFVSHAQEAREKPNHPAVTRTADEARVSGTPTAADAERKPSTSLAEQAMEMVTPPAQAPGSGPQASGVVASGAIVGPATTRVVPGPENCVCRGFVPEGLSPDGQHKPICEFYEDYKRANPNGAPGSRPQASANSGRVSQLSSTEPQRPMVIDLDSSKALRPATLEEEEQALTRLKATGFPLVIVDGHQYGVLFPKGADVPAEWIGDDDMLAVETPLTEDGITDKDIKDAREFKEFLRGPGKPNIPIPIPPNPDECPCKEFAETKEHRRVAGHHHSFCAHYENYKLLHPEIPAEQASGSGLQASGNAEAGGDPVDDAAQETSNGSPRRTKKPKARKKPAKKKTRARSRSKRA